MFDEHFNSSKPLMVIFTCLKIPHRTISAFFISAFFGVVVCIIYFIVLGQSFSSSLTLITMASFLQFFIQMFIRRSSTTRPTITNRKRQLLLPMYKCNTCTSWFNVMVKLGFSSCQALLQGSSFEFGSCSKCSSSSRIGSYH